MFKDYEDLMRQMEFEMQRSSAEAMRRLLELPAEVPDFWVPKADTYETHDEIVVRVEIAGVRKESLSVTLSADGRILGIRGVRSEAFVDDRPRARFHRLECYFGPFERDIPLPPNTAVDRERLTARYREGFLIVTLPKLVQSPPSRAIPIQHEEGDDA